MSQREILISKAANLIAETRSNSLDSNIVTLTSNDLENAGIKLEHQIRILEMMAEGLKLINYSFEWPNNDESTLSSETTKRLTSEAVAQQLHPKYSTYKFLSQKNFVVEVLPALKDYINKSNRNQPKLVTETVSVTVTLQGSQLFAGLRPGLNAPIGPPLKYGMAPHNFMHYLFAHPFQTINIHDIRENVDGCSTKDDLTELVRYCHFDKFLKSIFFERTTRTQVRFTPWRNLKSHEIQQYNEKIQQLLTEASKYRS